MEHAFDAMRQHQNYFVLPKMHIFHFVSYNPAFSIEVSRLYHEKDFLECKLADCVTYLQALRKKLGQNERRMSTILGLTRKKRKKVQQSTHKLEREIRNLEQDEHAFLNNLHACKANICVAKTLSYPSTGLLSTVPAFTSGSTRCSEPQETDLADIDWNGWTNDITISPFHKQSRNPFDDYEVAPEDCSHKDSIDEVVFMNNGSTLPLFRRGEEFGILMPHASKNIELPEEPSSTLSPTATAFEPQSVASLTASVDEQLQLLFNSTSLAKELDERPLVPRDSDEDSEGACCCSSSSSPQTHTRRLSLTWCSPTPQQKSTKTGNNDEGFIRCRMRSL